MTITVKRPSSELMEMISAAASSLMAFGELWDTIKKKGGSEGFQETELQEMLRPLLKDRLGMTKDKIYYLFHKEEVKEAQRERDQNNRKIAMNVGKKEPEQLDSTEDIFDKKPMTIAKDSTQFYKEQEVYPSKQAEDEPSPLELAEIKIQQLEDALHKTQQFTPATVLEDDMNVIKFRCGIDAFDKAVKTNQVQAKSRGWKTVEITMRAV